MAKHGPQEFLNETQLESVRCICLILRKYLSKPKVITHILNIIIKFTHYAGKDN